MNQLEKVRSDTLDLIQKLDQANVDWISTEYNWLDGENSEWSLGQHADHIVKVMDYIRTEVFSELIRLWKEGEPTILRKTLADIRLAPTYVPKRFDPLFETFFKLSNRLAGPLTPGPIIEPRFRYGRFPATTPEFWMPKSERLKDEPLSDLHCSVKDLRELCETKSNVDFDNMVFEHTVIGRHRAP